MSVGGVNLNVPNRTYTRFYFSNFLLTPIFSTSSLSNPVIISSTKIIFYNSLALVITACLNRGMRRNTSRICKVCTDEFNPARPWQQYCSRKCQIRDGMKRYRNRKAPAKCHNITVKVSRYPNAITPAPAPLLEALGPSSYGFGRPGDPPLYGDDYSLGYYPDGFPKLPPCLDWRKPKQKSVAS
jgi:hypothetical protein